MKGEKNEHTIYFKQKAQMKCKCEIIIDLYLNQHIPMNYLKLICENPTMQKR